MIPDVFPFKEKTSGIGQVEPQNNNKMMENFEFEEKINPWNIESLEDLQSQIDTLGFQRKRK